MNSFLKELSVSSNIHDPVPHVKLLYQIYQNLHMFKKQDTVFHCDDNRCFVYINTTKHIYIRIIPEYSNQFMYAIDIENDFWTVYFRYHANIFFKFVGFFKHFLIPINQITYVDTFSSMDLFELNCLVMQLAVDIKSVEQGFFSIKHYLFEPRLLYEILSFIR